MTDEFDTVWGGKDIEEKFPQWMTARIIMTEWVDNICGFSAIAGPKDFSTVLIELRTKSDVPLIAMVPYEDVLGVNEIYGTVMQEFVGEIARNALGREVTPMSLHGLASECEAKERECIARDGKGIQFHMARAFGLSPFRWLK